jgi:hypothetical protein
MTRPMRYRLLRFLASGDQALALRWARRLGLDPGMPGVSPHWLLCTPVLGGPADDLRNCFVVRSKTRSRPGARPLLTGIHAYRMGDRAGRADALRAAAADLRARQKSDFRAVRAGG